MKRCVIVGSAPIADYPAARAALRPDDFPVFCDGGLRHRAALGITPALIVGDFDSYPCPAGVGDPAGAVKTGAPDLSPTGAPAVTTATSPMKTPAAAPTATPTDAPTATTATIITATTTTIDSVVSLADPAMNRGDDSDLAGIPLRILPREKDDTDTVFAVKEALAMGFEEFLFLGTVGGRLDHSLGNLSLLLWLDTLGKKARMVDDFSEISVVSREKAVVDGHFSYFSILAMDGIARGVTETGVKFPLNNAIVTPEYAYGISNEVLPGERAVVSVEEGRLLLIKIR